MSRSPTSAATRVGFSRDWLWREGELAGVTCVRYKISADTLEKQPDFSLMHAAYFATRFVIEEPCAVWPVEFAIITAYATTGEDWTLQRNTTADEALAVRLQEGKLWHSRITGYSPTTGHTEPGWTADLSVEAACKLGQEFRQDAIYFVRDDLLFVTPCKPPCTLELVGKFWERLSVRGTASM